MIYGVFSVYDSLVGFSQPICEVNDAVAMRNFESLFTRSDMSPVMRMRPADFDLYKIGEYDSLAGDLKPIDHYKVIAGSSVALQIKGGADGV